MIVLKNKWKRLLSDIISYFKWYNINLSLKRVNHLLYENLQFLSIPTHLYKTWFINWVTSLFILKNWKSNNYYMRFV